MVKEIILIDSLTEFNYEKNGVSYLSKNHIDIKRQEITNV